MRVLICIFLGLCSSALAADTDNENYNLLMKLVGQTPKKVVSDSLLQGHEKHHWSEPESCKNFVAVLMKRQPYYEPVYDETGECVGFETVY